MFHLTFPHAKACDTVDSLRAGSATCDPLPLDRPRLWTLWGMLTLSAKAFITVMHSLFNLELLSRGKRGKFPPGIIASRDQACSELIQEFGKLDLPLSVRIVETMLSQADTAEAYHRAVDQLVTSVALELEKRKFYGPLRRLEQYYEQLELFGHDVFDRFPSANNDIYEAGMCLALERGTACVMHLMRVVEAGLKILAMKLEVGQQNDWGSYIREIDKSLETRKKTSGARSADEQFFAEASITIDSMRRAWRNPTLHIENNYSPERAEEILISVRSFMRHLATKLIEL
jgi:hypothetical protein